MAHFYVRLGPRGAIFRLGTGLIGLIGACVYWRASRKRVILKESAPVAVER